MMVPPGIYLISATIPYNYTAETVAENSRANRTPYRSAREHQFRVRRAQRRSRASECVPACHHHAY